MKPLLFTLTLVAFLYPLRARAAEPTELDAALVAPGADAAQIVELAIAGRFSSTCFRVAGYGQWIDLAAREIRLRQLAERTDAPCLRVLQPFARIVTLGKLPEGRYRVVDDVGGTELGAVTVESAPVAPPPLARVRELVVDAAARTARLTGDAGDRCARLAEIRVTYDDDAVVLEPRLDADTGCTGPVTFDRTIALRGDLAGLRLVQARSGDGRPLSRLALFE